MESSNQRLIFTGKGGDLFAILIVNWILTVITLGLYYPWAKVRRLKYHYDNSELDKQPFHFHGTGKEMFIGFIKAVGLFILFYAPLIIATIKQWNPIIPFLWFTLGILAITPIVIHGTYRYRMSRSSWRGIHFGYRGDLKQLTAIWFKGLFLTIITLGIYGAWFQMQLRNYVMGHLRYGSSEFKYKGDGWEYFLLNLKGYFLTILTLGIYGFWWQKNLFNYYVDNTTWNLTDGKHIRFRSTASGGDFFELLVINVLLVVFTLGIGLAWAEVRTMRLLMARIELIGDANLDQVVQTEEEHKDATADELGDAMDIGIFI